MAQRRSIFFLCIALAIVFSVLLASFAVTCEAKKEQQTEASKASSSPHAKHYAEIAVDPIDMQSIVKHSKNNELLSGGEGSTTPEPESATPEGHGNATTNGTTGDHGTGGHEGGGHSWAPNTPIGPILGWHSTQISETILVLCGFVFVIVVARILMVAVPEKYRLSRFLPDSALMILLGCAIGIVELILGTGESFNLLFSFDQNVFFMFLIPPIILDAGYFMNKQFFFKNIVLILTYAVLGTLLNAMAVGVSLFGISSLFQQTYTLLDFLMFGSLIAAVDPVAVLVIFEDLGVHETLHMLVFGESVLNDAVSIVLFNLFASLRKLDNLVFEAEHVSLAVIKFLYVSLGGTIIGCIIGLICSLVTRFSGKTPLLEPVIILSFSYFAYVLGEAFMTSGIMSIMFCGIVMSRYVELNISKKSHITFKHGVKLAASVSETLVFLYLGISIVVHTHVFDWFFLIGTTVFMILFRFAFCFLQTGVFNLIVKKKKRVSWREQFIMAYGGLRGAIAFALAVSFLVADSDFVKSKNSIITTTLFVIIFTIFVQGATIKPLLKLLRIKGHARTAADAVNDLRSEEMELGIEEKEISVAIDYINRLEDQKKQMQVGSPEYEAMERNNHAIVLAFLKKIVKHVTKIEKKLRKMNHKFIPQTDNVEVMKARSQAAGAIRFAWASHLDTTANASDMFFATNSASHAFSVLRQRMFAKKNQQGTVDGGVVELIPGLSNVLAGEQQPAQSSEVTARELEERKNDCVDILLANGVIRKDPVDNLYRLVDWAADDGFVFYLVRLLQDEAIAAWLRKAELVIENQTDYAECLHLLNMLHAEILKQQQNRSQMVDDLKKSEFAKRVFMLGVRNMREVALTISGKKAISRIKRWGIAADKFIQKIVVRGLYKEEQTLVNALDQLRKADAELKSDAERRDAQAGHVKATVESLLSQQQALAVLQQYRNDPRINVDRVMVGSGKVDDLFGDDDPFAEGAAKLGSLIDAPVQKRDQADEWAKTRWAPDSIDIFFNEDNNNQLSQVVNTAATQLQAQRQARQQEEQISPEEEEEEEDFWTKFNIPKPSGSSDIAVVDGQVHDGVSIHDDTGDVHIDVNKISESAKAQQQWASPARSAPTVAAAAQVHVVARQTPPTPLPEEETQHIPDNQPLTGGVEPLEDLDQEEYLAQTGQDRNQDEVDMFEDEDEKFQ